MNALDPQAFAPKNAAMGRELQRNSATQELSSTQAVSNAKYNQGISALEERLQLLMFVFLVAEMENENLENSAIMEIWQDA